MSTDFHGLIKGIVQGMRHEHKSQEDLMQEHDVCEKVRTCVRGYKHDGYHVNKHGFVLGATIG